MRQRTIAPSIMLITVATLVGTSACTTVGIGRVVPGARGRYRPGAQFGTQAGGSGWYKMGALGGDATEVGAGPLGLLLGSRLGVGSARLGDRPALEGGGFDVRLEGMFHLLPILAVGSSLGWGLMSAEASDRSLKVSRSGMHATGMATLAPFRPLMLRAGLVVDWGGTKVDNRDASSDTRLGVELGAGLAVVLRGWHFVWLLNWRRLGGDAITSAGVEDLTTSMYMLDLWLAF